MIQKVLQRSEEAGGEDLGKDFFIFVVNIMIPGPPFVCMVSMEASKKSC
jgi:hypothetical protein